MNKKELLFPLFLTFRFWLALTPICFSCWSLVDLVYYRKHSKAFVLILSSFLSIVILFLCSFSFLSSIVLSISLSFHRYLERFTIIIIPYFLVPSFPSVSFLSHLSFPLVSIPFPSPVFNLYYPSIDFPQPLHPLDPFVFIPWIALFI